MAQEWYVDVNGRVEGPFPLSELTHRAAAGLLLPTDSISVDGVRWSPASEMLEVTFSPPHAQQLEETTTAPTDASKRSTHSALETALLSVPGYEIREKLGAGACGVVFRAVQLKLNRVVALKTVRLTANASSSVVARFEQEALALARLQHPNIVAVHDCGHTAGHVFFAMELLDGEDLKQRLDRTGPVDERTAWLIARQTAAALAHAAKLGVIHRDVKPANLFLVPAPTGFPLPSGVPMVKVTDFGLALTRSDPNDSQHDRTAEGVLLGTPVYMAPEQFSSSDVDVRADIYSLGATLYHILAGRTPFQGQTVWELMSKKAVPPQPLQAPISAATSDLVAAMMAVDASKRPADYTELLTRIDSLPCLADDSNRTGLRAAEGEPSTNSPSRFARIRRFKWWVFGLLTVLAVGFGVTVAWNALKRSRPNNIPNPTYTVVAQDLLYDGRSMVGWAPEGGFWVLESDNDIEQTIVLTGSGGVARPYRPLKQFRVLLTFDLHKAGVVEIVLATSDGGSGQEEQWLVRLDRKEGATFGKRAGPGGTFERVGELVAIPSPEELQAQGRRLYLEVRYERAGGMLTAWYRGKFLGRTADTGLQMSELRIQAIGGPVRIDFASIEELVEK